MEEKSKTSSHEKEEVRQNTSESYELYRSTYSYMNKKLWIFDGALALMALPMGRYEWSLGFLVGGAIAHFWNWTLKRDLDKVVLTERFNAKVLFRGHLIRYIGTGILLGIAFQLDFVNIITDKIDLHLNKGYLITVCLGFFMKEFVNYGIAQAWKTQKGV